MELQTRKKVRLGDLLMEKGLISEDQLMQALAEQKKTGKKIGRAITDLGFVQEDQLLQALSDYFNYPFIDLARFKLRQDLIQLLPETQARRFRCVVLAEEPQGLLVGMADPMDLMTIYDLQRVLKRPVMPAVVREHELLSIL